MVRRYQFESAREIGAQLARTRREFLRATAGMALGSALLPANAFAGAKTSSSKRKIIVVTFGGGARDQETFAPEGQENIPAPDARTDSAVGFLYPGRESRNPRPLRGDRQPGHRRLRNDQQFCRPSAGASHRLRVLPQGLEAPGLRRLGRRPEQRIQSHRRKQPPLLRSRVGRERDSAEASADGRHRRSGQRLRTSAARQLRDAVLHAGAARQRI